MINQINDKRIRSEKNLESQKERILSQIKKLLRFEKLMKIIETLAQRTENYLKVQEQSKEKCKDHQSKIRQGTKYKRLQTCREKYDLS